ncbi:anti-sigma factor [Pseudalkalibacillus caeni]|uniref:Anti-sigma factor n=1 Tax=Exobacillus caeni TaxID=2574798 RepID=A0A5R9F9C6_9BACL|nr:anti-sigma factor [Pseudalkalibacillus caeni]TLS37144.1 anti-sigma factor [Pseudalkalibacillus caeni]
MTKKDNKLHDVNFDSILNEAKQTSILNKGKRQARWRTIVITLLILLMITPVAFLSTLMYYSFGNKANDYRDVVISTFALTEPNVLIDPDKVDNVIHPFFSIDYKMDLLKTVGAERKWIGEYDTTFTINNLTKQDKRMITEKKPEIPLLENRMLFHPDAFMPYSREGWDQLEKLPEGTVSEVYFSLTDTYKPEEVKDLFNDFDIMLLWYAVDTGLDGQMKDPSGDNEGVYLPPIGYPAGMQSSPNDPFSKDESNEKQFLQELKFIQQHEELATDVARAKTLALEERIDYLDKNGIAVYGIVATGPSKELLKLRELEEIRGCRIGSIDFWNWNKESGSQ